MPPLRVTLRTISNSSSNTISDVSELGITGQREQKEKKEKSNKTAFLLEAGTQKSKIKQVPSSIPGTDDIGFLL